MSSNNPFHYSNFLSHTGFYKELFDEFDNAWDSLPHIEDFIIKFKQSAASTGFKEIKENVFVGYDVQIDPTSRIDGPAIIGHKSIIGHAAFIRGGVLLGENVNIGHASEIKHSIILSNAAIAHLNYVGDSIIGCDVNISGGAILANFRLDKKKVTIRHEDSKIDTNLEKFGSFIGDNSRIGVNAVLNPGTVLAKDIIVYPLIEVKGVHLASGIIK